MILYWFIEFESDLEDLSESTPPPINFMNNNNTETETDNELSNNNIKNEKINNNNIKLNVPSKNDAYNVPHRNHHIYLITIIIILYQNQI